MTCIFVGPRSEVTIPTSFSPSIPKKGESLGCFVGNAGALEVRTAVSFKTGSFAPDYFALATQSMIVLPWDREILIDGELRPNPKYAGVVLEG